MDMGTPQERVQLIHKSVDQTTTRSSAVPGVTKCYTQRRSDNALKADAAYQEGDVCVTKKHARCISALLVAEFASRDALQ